MSFAWLELLNCSGLARLRLCGPLLSQQQIRGAVGAHCQLCTQIPVVKPSSWSAHTQCLAAIHVLHGLYKQVVVNPFILLDGDK